MEVAYVGALRFGGGANGSATATEEEAIRSSLFRRGVSVRGGSRRRSLSGESAPVTGQSKSMYPVIVAPGLEAALAAAAAAQAVRRSTIAWQPMSVPQP